MVSFYSLLPAISLLSVTAPRHSLTSGFINTHRAFDPITKRLPVSRVRDFNPNDCLRFGPISDKCTQLSASNEAKVGSDSAKTFFEPCEPFEHSPLDPTEAIETVSLDNSNPTGLTQPATFQPDNKNADPNRVVVMSAPDKPVPPFRFISADKMQELKSKYKSQAFALDAIKEKFFFHEAFDQDKPLQLFLMDSQGLSLALANDIAIAHDRGCFVLPPNTDLNVDIARKFIQFMSEHPDGIVVVPSISNFKPAHYPPEFLVAKGLPVGFSSVFQFAKLAQEGITLDPQSPPIFSKNKFLFIIANKNINNPDKVFGFHNKDVDTSSLNADIFLAYMGVASQKYHTDHSSVVMLDNLGLKKEEYIPLIESFIPEKLTASDRKAVINHVMTHANEKTDYQAFKHLAADKIAQILTRNDN